MYCFHCQGELQRGQTTYTVNRHGYHLVIDQVPAWVCEQCHEPLFDEKQVAALQHLILAVEAEMPLVLQPA